MTVVTPQHDRDVTFRMAEDSGCATAQARACLAACRARYDEPEESHTVLAALPETLGELRHGCPPLEGRDLIPCGEAFEDPYGRSCPRCQAERDTISFLETRRLYGEGFSGAPSHRPSFFESSSREHVVAGSGGLNLNLVAGARAADRFSEARIDLSAEGHLLEVWVEGTPSDILQLVLEGDIVERRMAFAGGQCTLSFRGRLIARVRPAGGKG